MADNYKQQTERIAQAVKDLCPTCSVTFDSARVPDWIRFRIVSSGGTELTKAWPEFHVSEVADWSETKLKQTIDTVTGGLVRMDEEREKELQRYVTLLRQAEQRKDEVGITNLRREIDRLRSNP